MSPDEETPPPDGRDVLIHIRGTVQGVGFRPFIARLAARERLTGWVRNDTRGVTLFVRGAAGTINELTKAIRREAPPAARIDELRTEIITTPETDSDSVPAPILRGEFRILQSPETEGRLVASVTPDLATCEDCRIELLDPANRRYRYPFINCTNCGPRYSILNALPYDRERTTMSHFTMCAPCHSEYVDPLDRRYHAQPNACPECGPGLRLLDMDGEPLASRDEALEKACATLASGGIVAIKGIGGFHLFADAGNDEAVTQLRQRKHRDEKPFAVMFPSLECLREHAVVSEEEAELLTSPAAPIVLVKRRRDSSLPPSIAPGNPWIGAILPYTPLHIILMHEFAGPLIATSANLSEEPLCHTNEDAVQRLSGIADSVLQHNREIARPVDDSVQRVSRHGPLLLRRARGYAPAPVQLPKGCFCAEPILSLGGHLKSTVAISMEQQIVVSPHIGDLANSAAIAAFHKTIDLLVNLYGGATAKVVCDLHPDYVSTRIAEAMNLPIVRVQHHLAHILACLLEHGGGPDQVLGVSWDGTGYGEDGTIWGGEFILVNRLDQTARRVAHLKPFQLPSGEAAIRQTGRCALGALAAADLIENPHCRSALEAALGEDWKHHDVLLQALLKRVNAPVTTSAGRLFDAAAGLLGLAAFNTFEGQAGMAMEFAAEAATPDNTPFPYALTESTRQAGALEIDWSPMLDELCKLKQAGANPADLSLRFHVTLSEMILQVARSIGVKSVALTGGCFQNALLSDLATERLHSSGFSVLLHHELSPNDNSISAGQALGALWDLTRVKT